MTVIVGLVHKNTVYMGGDSAFVGGWYSLAVRPNEKVFDREGVLFGVAGSARAINLLRYHMQVPSGPSEDLPGYMATVFVDAMRDCFKTGGYAKKENEVEDITSSILVGINGRLFEFDSDYQVQEVIGYSAIGSGGQVALGALYATEKRNPYYRVQTALEAAEKFNAGVRGPFQILKA